MTPCGTDWLECGASSPKEEYPPFGRDSFAPRLNGDQAIFRVVQGLRGKPELPIGPPVLSSASPADAPGNGHRQHATREMKMANPDLRPVLATPSTSPHTVRILEQAGASAIQIEDQHAPKRCGHFDGKELIPPEEMVGKVRAAVDTRRQDLVVIARTDACAVEGFEAAIERAGRYIEAGADVTFVEAPESLEDLKAVPRRLKAPQLVNMVLGGKTPIIDEKAAAEMGFSLVLYANAALQGAVHGMQSTLSALKEKGVLDERAVTSFAERQRLVDKPAFDLLEARYAAHAASDNR